MLFYLFLITIPFGARILIYQFTPEFHEYEAAFLYASDILLVLFLGVWVFHSYVLKNVRMKFKRRWPLVIFLFLSFGSIFFAFSKGLAIYSFVRLVLLILFALATAKIIREGMVKIEHILAIIAGSAVFQAMIAFLQFAKQSSLGLKFLGESVLGSDVSGAAKIAVDGVKILRAYGTFPHPNVLAAFLLMGLFSLYYLWLKTDAKFLNANDTKKSISRKLTFVSVILVSAIFVVLAGLILTFSRTAWVVGGLLTLFSLAYFIFLPQYRRAASVLSLMIVASSFALAVVFSPYIRVRAAVSQTEPAVVYRLSYNKMALDIIKKNPFGVGIGNQVLYSVKNGIYQKFGMDQPWQWQPAHNIYFLIASEVGLLGLFVFLIFVAKLVISNWKLRDKLLLITAYQLLFTLLLFGFVDHFLWTLQPGRLMLWLIIGILIGVSSAHSTMDSAQPSEG